MDIIEIFKSKKSRHPFWWRKKARNGRIISGSLEGYKTKSGVKKAVMRESLWYLLKIKDLT